MDTDIAQGNTHGNTQDIAQDIAQGNTHGTPKPVISIVVPCLNEEGGIQVYLDALREQAPTLPSLEVIIVDDGSTDGTCDAVRRLGPAYPFRVRLVKLSRNFGHQLALLAGMREARGEACITMDVDLQDPMAVLPLMVQRWREGSMVVIGKRDDRSSDSWFKRVSADLFYRLLAFLTNGAFPAHVGDFRLIDRKVLDIMAQIPEAAPYWRGLSIWVGFPRAVVSYRRERRAQGETKFPLSKMAVFALNAIFSFSRKPLQLAGFLGISVSLLSFGVILYHFALLLFQKHYVAGWLSTISFLGLVGGIQLVCIGILGEYVGRIYELSLGRPNVIIQESSIVVAAGATSPTGHQTMGNQR